MKKKTWVIKRRTTMVERVVTGKSVRKAYSHLGRHRVRRRLYYRHLFRRPHEHILNCFTPSHHRGGARSQDASVQRPFLSRAPL